MTISSHFSAYVVGIHATVDRTSRVPVTPSDTDKGEPQNTQANSAGLVRAFTRYPWVVHSAVTQVASSSLTRV